MTIANCSGFYGDRYSAMAEVLDGGHVDVVTGDYLAELTMLILARQKAKDPAEGYAKTFAARLRDNLAAILARDIKVVVNAGGMNPTGLADAITAAAGAAGVPVRVAAVHSDDLTDRADELGFSGALAANAYLGAYGIVRALERGAQIVVTGRVTDASLAVGAAAWWHGWHRNDFDALAGAMAAGHVIECGTQATGGNYAFFTEIPDLLRPGFPLAEIAADGTSVITKHPGTGGAVTEETVLSQLLYEVQTARYAGPDAVLRLDSLTLEQVGPDRVEIRGARGEAPPPELKVSVTQIGGYANDIEWYLTGLDAKAKAELVRSQFEAALPVRPAELVWSFAQADVEHAAIQEEATSVLRVVAKDPDPKKVGRAFANVAIEYALASSPGLFAAAPPREGRVFGRYRPAFVSQDVPTHTVRHADGTEEVIPSPAETRELTRTDADSHSPAGSAAAVPQPAGETVPLGRFFGARSGDKGGSANIGVWARSAVGADWLMQTMTAELLRELIPEIRDCDIDRTELRSLGAVNFVIHGILGEGAASQARFDPQAKGLAEFLRSRRLAVPEAVRTAAVERGGNP